MTNPLKPLVDGLPKPLRNKYFLSLAIFAFLMVFVDKHDVLTQIRLQRTVNKLEADKEFYGQKIEEAKQERLELELNDEKFARERYYMRKSNEDVFIIDDEEK